MVTEAGKAQARDIGSGKPPKVATSITATVAAVSYTAANPAAPTAYSSVSTTNPVTNTEGDAISAALKTLRDEVALYELQISAIIVDDLAQDVAIDALATDVAAIRTELVALGIGAA